MAFCKKCGGGKLRKNKAKQYYCKHCGVQPGRKGYDRSGIFILKKEEQDDS